MGLVMSLANPQSAKREVTRIKGSSRFLGTRAGFWVIGMRLKGSVEMCVATVDIEMLTGDVGSFIGK